MAALRLGLIASFHLVFLGLLLTALWLAPLARVPSFQTSSFVESPQSPARCLQRLELAPPLQEPAISAVFSEEARRKEKLFASCFAAVVVDRFRFFNAGVESLLAAVPQPLFEIWTVTLRWFRRLSLHAEALWRTLKDHLRCLYSRALSLWPLELGSRWASSVQTRILKVGERLVRSDLFEWTRRSTLLLPSVPVLLPPPLNPALFRANAVLSFFLPRGANSPRRKTTASRKADFAEAAVSTGFAFLFVVRLCLTLISFISFLLLSRASCEAAREFIRFARQSERRGEELEKKRVFLFDSLLACCLPLVACASPLVLLHAGSADSSVSLACSAVCLSFAWLWKATAAKWRSAAVLERRNGRSGGNDILQLSSRRSKRTASRSASRTKEGPPSRDEEDLSRRFVLVRKRRVVESGVLLNAEGERKRETFCLKQKRREETARQKTGVEKLRFLETRVWMMNSFAAIGMTSFAASVFDELLWTLQFPLALWLLLCQPENSFNCATKEKKRLLQRALSSILTLASFLAVSCIASLGGSSVEAATSCTLEQGAAYLAECTYAALAERLVAALRGASVFLTHGADWKDIIYFFVKVERRSVEGLFARAVEVSRAAVEVGTSGLIEAFGPLLFLLAIPVVRMVCSGVRWTAKRIAFSRKTAGRERETKGGEEGGEAVRRASLEGTDFGSMEQLKKCFSGGFADSNCFGSQGIEFEAGKEEATCDYEAREIPWQFCFLSLLPSLLALLFQCLYVEAFASFEESAGTSDSPMKRGTRIILPLLLPGTVPLASLAAASFYSSLVRAKRALFEREGDEEAEAMNFAELKSAAPFKEASRFMRRLSAATVDWISRPLVDRVSLVHLRRASSCGVVTASKAESRNLSWNLRRLAEATWRQRRLARRAFSPRFFFSVLILICLTWILLCSVFLSLVRTASVGLDSAGAQSALALNELLHLHLAFGRQGETSVAVEGTLRKKEDEDKRQAAVFHRLYESAVYPDAEDQGAVRLEVLTYDLRLALGAAGFQGSWALKASRRSAANPKELSTLLQRAAPLLSVRRARRASTEGSAYSALSCSREKFKGHRYFFMSGRNVPCTVGVDASLEDAASDFLFADLNKLCRVQIDGEPLVEKWNNGQYDFVVTERNPLSVLADIQERASPYSDGSPRSTYCLLFSAAGVSEVETPTAALQRVVAGLSSKFWLSLASVEETLRAWLLQVLQIHSNAASRGSFYAATPFLPKKSRRQSRPIRLALEETAFQTVLTAPRVFVYMKLQNAVPRSKAALRGRRRREQVNAEAEMAMAGFSSKETGAT